MSSGCVGGDGEEGEWRERRERGGRCQRAPTPRTRTRTRSHTPHTGEREQRRGCHPVSRVSEQARRGGRAGAPCLSSWRPRAAAPPESAHSGPDSAPQAAPGSRPSRPPTLCWGDGERLGKKSGGSGGREGVGSKNHRRCFYHRIYRFLIETGLFFYPSVAQSARRPVEATSPSLAWRGAWLGRWR